MALTIASLAAKRMARKRSRRWVSVELRALRRQQQVLDEARAEALEGARDALRLEHVDADAVDHARAASISAFISRTAARQPDEQRVARRSRGRC